MIESGRGLSTRTAQRLTAPVDIAWLAAFRMLFGMTMCVSLLRFLFYDWVNELFILPEFHFRYFGFHWLPAPDPTLTYGLFIGLAVLALGVALGLAFRVASFAFAIGFTYLQLLDVTTYLNHYYLAVLLSWLLALAPAHRAWSVDAWLRPRLARASISGLWLLLFRFQVGVVYTFAGIAKAYPDWLLHGQPLRIWLNSRTDLPLLGAVFAQPGAALWMSWAGFLFDSTVIWFLLWPKTRSVAYLAVIGFHTVTGLMFPIGMFPVIMIVAALVFFPPSWPRALAHRLRLTALAEPPSLSNRTERNGRWFQVGVGLATAYCAVQLLLPLRFLAYGGDVRWHEQGMRFSWRVMVREKNGSTTFLVHSPEAGRTWHISPHHYLTRLQEREMAGQPDLILQLAHHIARDFAARGFGQVSVKVDSLVSMNGRRLHRFIDPDVDLTQVSDGLLPTDWVLPAPTEAPPELRPVPVAQR